MAKTFNPKNFALIAGEAMDPASEIPRVFSYYAEDDYLAEILNGPGPVLVPTGTDFFGLRTDGSGTALTQEEKLLPSAANQLCKGCGIMIYGPNQTDSSGIGFGKYFILYLRVTSRYQKDTAYTRVLLYEQP